MQGFCRYVSVALFVAFLATFCIPTQNKKGNKEKKHVHGRQRCHVPSLLALFYALFSHYWFL